MAIILMASVGRMGGINHAEDVRKVQHALNKVPKSEGGPPKPLDPNGNCGPKTIEAIQLFQIKHFGWSGADGRVDVNGPTHQKLNEYDSGMAPPVVETMPTSESFSVRIDSISKPTNEEWQVLITDEANQISRVYRLEQTVHYRPLEKCKVKWTKPYPLVPKPPKPISVTDFHGAKFGYGSTLHYNPKKQPDRTWINVMALQLVEEDRQTNYFHTPTEVWDCSEEMRKNVDKPGTYMAGVMGLLKLIENADVQTPLAFSAPTVLRSDRPEIEIMKRLRRT
jgi:hypothetical protein